MRIWIAVIVFATASMLLADEQKVAPIAQRAFTFKDKPIHPGVVSEFEVWPSDGEPARVKTVDLESCATSNKNFEPPKKFGDTLTCKAGDGWFGYKHLGVTSSGTHVLLVEANGGGTMVAMTIYLLRFDKEEYFVFKASTQPLVGEQRPVAEQRVVLRCVGQIVVGDRDDGMVTLAGDTLTLGKSRYREKAAVYKLP